MCMSEHASLKSFEFSAKYNGLFDISLKKGSVLHPGFFSEQLIFDFSN